MTDRLARRRFNVLDRAELELLAAWYDGIAEDYAEADRESSVSDVVRRSELFAGHCEARARADEFRKLAANA
jgi:hypothetical protein